MADVALSYAAIEQLPSFMRIMTKAHSSGLDTHVRYNEEILGGMRDDMIGSSVRAYRHAQDSHDSASSTTDSGVACDLGTLWFTHMGGATAGSELLRRASSGAVISSEETSASNNGRVTISLVQGSLIESFADVGMNFADHAPLKEW